MTEHLPAHERFIVCIDQYPWGAFYRIGLGYAVPLLYYRMTWKAEPEWFLVPWFLCCLLFLRIVPAILRKALPFSESVNRTWIERREMAKRYDSYQWRKLVWFGIGMAGFMALRQAWNGVTAALTMFCMIGGGIGHVFWRKICAAGKSIID